MSLKLKQKGIFDGKILYKDVNNPGENDCGFYSFAMGLINIIQRDLAKGNNAPEQLRILNAVSNAKNKYTADDFTNFSYNLRNRADRALLSKLKSDLRQILHNQYLQEIYHNSVYIEGRADGLSSSMPFVQFLEVFNSYHHKARIAKKWNLLYQNEELKHFAKQLAYDLADERDPFLLNRAAERAFLEDLYGEDYLDQTMVPWKETLAVQPNEQLELAQADKDLLAKFKKFQMVVEDFYTSRLSHRHLEQGFPYKREALLYARELRERKRALKHQQVKILLGDELLDQDDLEAETLYYQIVDAENNVVRVYSPYFEQSYQLADAKAQDLIKQVSAHLSVDEELTIDNDIPDLFKQLLAKANDTIDQEIILKSVPDKFLELYAKSEFNLGLDQLDDEQQLRIGEVSRLLNLGLTVPLSYPAKENLRSLKAVELQIQETSIIANALAYIKEDREWLATDHDLKYLADLFKVHLEILENGRNTERSRGANPFARPRITINNLGNYHWTTRLSVGYQTSKDSLKYAGWVYKKATLDKEEIKALLLTYTTGFISFFGRAHLQKANELIARCNDEQSSVADIMTDFRGYMYAQEYIPGDSFLKRFEYLDARHRTIEDVLLTKRDIERVFANYIHSGYIRNHLVEARRIIGDCRDPEMDINEICLAIEDYVEKTQFNSDSSFMDCVREVRDLKQFADRHEVDDEHSLPLNSIF
ncbi:hypothetical protein BN59_02715 [Legionella massiliensis]|uniref:Dot/Icm T4SS effector n=1 Tax=Legionella massiliensis TaxID=1034943 RepID=A0A078KVE2_9GAMM|nr:hypothetical protein [Legionella massiliensis]CDZ78405.1 hypothetical protein BN59_02715 [Legionella massiliensis]CEE14143.1 hypothetical protein BN1094_02715 [Legionella massiliensis]